MLGDLAGQLRAFLLHVPGRCRRMVQQLFDLVQGRAPGEEGGDQPDHGDGGRGQQHQAQAQGLHAAASFAMT
jgi:hypothetical protein